MLSKAAFINALISAVSAGTILWDGRFNDMTSSADLEKWSFSNPIGSYQYYIHGSGAVSDYVNLDSTYKNPADTGSKQGVKITIDETAKWNGQTMLRTELIPQTTAAINKGKVYYHFSIKTTGTNKPTDNNEHQIAFFESHFTELKYGASGSSNTNLQWHVGGVSKWDVELVADEWHNVAYEIDFDAGSVSFYHSTGSDALTKTAGPFDASTSSNGADWHLGVLRLPGSNDAAGAEDWFFSGVYVENGDLTTSINSAGGAASGDSAPASSAAATAAATSSASSAAASSAAASTSVTSSTVPVSSAVKTPVVSSSATTVESPVASATPVESKVPVPSSTTAAAPSSTAGADVSTELPTEFTLKEFIAWLKAKNGQN
ncbi:glycoside hydrolase family 131 protein [Didymella exigua CBS 183.55]|uniref:Glycoside hydrolase family 131 protein n=1 Tax=Didymella exigua CBS 183.55 TaxID=1150837 RepID=A0A6A5S1W3_9PLEO|nr:glycoside hydrolase family 131 protein [Didymella exigua CBS 183.55]KAF1933769.1 glycoside hydrolase family 131 protein [Didymella exigua CBS 183.55]